MNAPSQRRPIVIALHYQNDVLHPDGRIRVGIAEQDAGREALLGAARRLLDGARQRDWPIVHVRVAYRRDYADLQQNAPIFRAVARSGAVRDGDWGSAFYPPLAPDLERDEFVVQHTRINAFYGSTLEPLLAALGGRQLLIAGVATHSVVESTVRHAVDCGFEVSVAEDACSAARSETHQASLESMRLIAEVLSVEQALEAFA